MQGKFTLATTNNELKIKFGPVRYGTLDSKPREGAYDSVRYLYSDVNNICKYYIRLGFHLDEFSRCEYYKDFGFSTLDEFCERNLGLDKSAVSRCINVYHTFNASKSITYDNGLKKVGAATDLAKEWEDYSYSQLCEMLSLSPDQRRNISPDMSVRQIREYKKSLKNNNTEKSVATSQPEREKFDYNKYQNKQGIVLFNYIKSLAYEKPCGLTIFDHNGKEIYCDVVDFLYDGIGGLYIRLRDDKNLKE